jgi:hypothetical protein
MILTNQNYIHEEIRNRLKSENAFCSEIHNILCLCQPVSPHDITTTQKNYVVKSLKINIY